MATYREFHCRSIAERDTFWAEEAKLVHWNRPFRQTLDYARPPFAGSCLIWGMGITQHEWGADNVRMILNLALARGFLGRDKCGVMPIRGHSSVQGGAEMGAYSTAFPGGKPVNTANAAALSAHYGFPVPDWPGLTATEMVEAGARGELDVLYCLGGNFLRTLPEPDYVAAAMGNIQLRVHQDIILTDQMFIEPREEVILLPAKTRYEQDGGGTETITERRIIFSPEIPGRRVGEAVATGDADRGVVCCWTGTGVSIAANKVPGVRAALCTDAETARGAGAGTTPTCSRSACERPPRQGSTRSSTPGSRASRRPRTMTAQTSPI